MDALLKSGPAILIRVAAVVFLHAAYSAWEARSSAKAAGVTLPTTLGSPLPPDILIETLVAFVLLSVGVTWSADSLKEIPWASEMATRSIDSEDSRLSFASMRHRGRILFPET